VLEVRKLRALEAALSSVRATAAMLKCSPTQVWWWRQGAVNFSSTQLGMIEARCLARLASLEALVCQEGPAQDRIRTKGDGGQ
jgi:hypothetical protein